MARIEKPCSPCEWHVCFLSNFFEYAATSSVNQPASVTTSSSEGLILLVPRPRRIGNHRTWLLYPLTEVVPCSECLQKEAGTFWNYLFIPRCSVPSKRYHSTPSGSGAVCAPPPFQSLLLMLHDLQNRCMYVEKRNWCHAISWWAAAGA